MLIFVLLKAEIVRTYRIERNKGIEEDEAKCEGPVCDRIVVFVGRRTFDKRSCVARD